MCNVFSPFLRGVYIYPDRIRTNSGHSATETFLAWNPALSKQSLYPAITSWLPALRTICLEDTVSVWWGLIAVSLTHTCQAKMVWYASICDVAHVSIFSALTPVVHKAVRARVTINHPLGMAWDYKQAAQHILVTFIDYSLLLQIYLAWVQ